MRVVSTWGHVHIAGLSEIQVFDIKGNLILMQPSELYVRGAPPSAQ